MNRWVCVAALATAALSRWPMLVGRPKLATGDAA
jgi:hypothetical protein